MRHLRMVGVCLIAAVALSVAAAVPALAKETIKEGTHNIRTFKNCSFGNPEAHKCTVAATTPGAGGYYKVGSITVPVVNQIILQGGLGKQQDEEEGAPFLHGQKLFPPENGVPPIAPVAEPVPGEPLGHITEAEMEEFGWPQALKESYEKARAHGEFAEGKTTEQIEAAGKDQDWVSEYNILIEEIPGVLANVQIQGKNKWLAKLGGECLIGSEADPVVQHLTSGESTSPSNGETLKGTSGDLYTFNPKTDVAVGLTESILVDNTYAVPGALGCGGPANEAYLDPAVNRAFGLPALAGESVTKLDGALYTSSTAGVRQEFGRHGS